MDIVGTSGVLVVATLLFLFFVNVAILYQSIQR